MIIPKGLEAIIECLRVTDKQAGVITNPRIAGTESCTGKVVGYFMIINCRQDGRRAAQSSEGIEPISGRIHFVTLGAEIDKSAALAHWNVGRREVGINVVAKLEEKV